MKKTSNNQYLIEKDGIHSLGDISYLYEDAKWFNLISNNEIKIPCFHCLNGESVQYLNGVEIESIPILTDSRIIGIVDFENDITDNLFTSIELLRGDEIFIGDGVLNVFREVSNNKICIFHINSRVDESDFQPRN